MIPSVVTRSGEATPTNVDEEEYEFVQEWKTSIPAVSFTDKDKIEGIKDNIQYILRRHPFFLKPADFANDKLYLRPEYGTPSLEWDMVDIIDFTCEIQNKMNIEISDETMYLDFIQLKDVYNYLYQLKPTPADSKGKEEASEQKVDTAGNIPAAERTMLVFPGQGAQKLGMGEGLGQKFPEAQELFDKAKEVLGYDIMDICLNGPVEKLNSTEISQPALFVVSMAALARLKKEDPARLKNCVCVAGLSLGEYTALVVAGVISFEDGLRLVQARGKAMQAAADSSPSGMVSILGTGVTEAKVIEMAAAVTKSTNSKCFVSNILCLGNIVVSGSTEAMEEVTKVASNYGASKAVKLAVAGAFHSEFMRPAYNSLKEVLDKVEFKKPSIPVMFNVDAEIEDDVGKIKSKLLDQLVKPVLWERSMNNCLRNYDLAHVIEVGPGNVLTGIMRRILKSSDAAVKPRPSTLSV